MLYEGQHFGEGERYELVKQLGFGGFSEVWLATDTMTNVQVAIKVYATNQGMDSNGIEMFKREFSVVFDMNHTNLLRPTYYGSWERMPYLIMPLCRKGSLYNRYIEKGQTISEQKCWLILHDVAAGLAYLHQKETPVIHQDIKPDNILIGDDDHYLITDFGISSHARETVRRLSPKGQSGGTLAYMAPERFSSRPRPIPASDIWSLGAMMFELMTGALPFGTTGGAAQRTIRKPGDPLEVQSTKIPEIEGAYSQELKNLVYLCISEEVKKRPTANEIEDFTYKHLHWGQTVHDNPEPDKRRESSPMRNENPDVPRSIQDSYRPQNINQSRDSYSFSSSQGLNYNPQGGRELGGSNQQGVKSSGGHTWLMLAVISVIAIILIILLVFYFLSKGNSTETPVLNPVETGVSPKNNLDKDVEQYLLYVKDYAKKANKYENDYEEDPLNIENGKVETFYIDILDKCAEYARVKSLHPDDKLTDPSLEEQLGGYETKARNRLKEIHGMLQEDIKVLKRSGLHDQAERCQERCNAIQPFIAEPL